MHFKFVRFYLKHLLYIWATLLKLTSHFAWKNMILTLEKHFEKLSANTRLLERMLGTTEASEDTRVNAAELSASVNFLCFCSASYFPTLSNSLKKKLLTHSIRTIHAYLRVYFREHREKKNKNTKNTSTFSCINKSRFRHKKSSTCRSRKSHLTISN